MSFRGKGTSLLSLFWSIRLTGKVIQWIICVENNCSSSRGGFPIEVSQFINHLPELLAISFWGIILGVVLGKETHEPLVKPALVKLPKCPCHIFDFLGDHNSYYRTLGNQETTS